MRLKASLNLPGVERFQLRKYCPERWLPSQENEDRTKNICQDVRCRGYTPNMASPAEENNDESIMSLCPERNGDTGDEDDSSTDSDFSETSPLLADFEEDSVEEEEDNDDGIDDCNNNLRRSVQTSQDSLLSDAFTMSALKEHHLAVENFRNNNNLPSLNGLYTRHDLPTRVPLVEDAVRGSFFTSTEEKFPSREIDIKTLGDETVCPTSNPKTSVLPDSSSTTIMAGHVQTQYLPDVLPVPLKHQDVTLNGTDSSRLSQETSPMSDSSISSDTDVNLATHSFNNFTLSASKHNDILYLVQEEKKPKEINILETEPKILNTTTSSLPRNMSRRYQLRNDYNRTGTEGYNSGLRDSSSSSQLHSLIADGLILEKVGPRESWPHHHTLYSSDDSMKQFPAGYSLTNCQDEPKTEPARDNNEVSNKNHDHFCIEHNVSLPNLSPDPRHSSPPRKKEMVSSDLSSGDISPKEKKTLHDEKCDDVGHYTPCAMDIESPTDNLYPVSAVANEVPQTDENDNRDCNSYELVNSNKNEVSAATVVTTQDDSVITLGSCTEPAPDKTRNKSVSPGKELLGDFDVYNIETTMPTIDWVAMEAHLTRAAAEDDWLVRRRNDREEIRKKLAMDSDTEDYYCGERVTRKPSLSTRLQSGMNLQICFMNETASDQESQNSDHDTDSGHSDLNSTDQRTPSPIGDRIRSCFNSDLSTSPLVLHCEEDSQTTSSSNSNNSNHRLISSVSEKNSLNSENVSNGNATSNNKKQRPSFFFARQKSWRLRPKQKSTDDQEEKGTSSQDSGRFDPTEDFYTRHARLQAEARMALAQAKEMARMQMEVERQKSKKSPIADIVGLPFPDNRHRLSRQILTDMNVAQLQVIVNDLHTQIENLNEDLVQLLLTRDDLHMEQDSMLVDIEDLTRYFRAKDEAQQQQPVSAALCKSSSKK